MRKPNVRYLLVLPASLMIVAGGTAGRALAADQNIDLNGDATKESNCKLTVLNSYPAKVENKITNKSVGQAFSFNWVSAGPGGFSSTAGNATSPGNTNGVGAIWDWQTNQQIYSFTGKLCSNDVCFTQTFPPPPTGGSPTQRGPFQAPGRSLVSSGVTSSSASLTSSLITFFSPLNEVLRVSSSVRPTTSGQIFYQTQVTNTSNAPVTVDLAPGPLGCNPCPEGGTLCGGECVDTFSDPSNCGSCGHQCSEGESCSEGSCSLFCDDNSLTPCEGECVDTQTDPGNCGGCGIACSESQTCSGGECVACAGGLTLCGGECVSLLTDPNNCGSCGNVCPPCPFGGQETCTELEGNGVCTSSACPPGLSPAAASGGSASAPRLTAQGRSPASGSKGSPANLKHRVRATDEGAPPCEFPGAQNLQIPPGGTQIVDCHVGIHPAKEISSQMTACGDAIPQGDPQCSGGGHASQGPFELLVEDTSINVGDAYLTPFEVQMLDSSGDGFLQPGETANLVVLLHNIGPKTITGASGLLSSPPVDMTLDGTDDPSSVNISSPSSPYTNIAGLPTGSGQDCGSALPAVQTPGYNTLPFVVTVPPDHPGDVARLFNVHITGQTGATATGFAQDVPFVLAIHGGCNPASIDGQFDGLKGLLPPVGVNLVLEGQKPNVPRKPYKQGQTVPLKLKMFCGAANLTDSDVAAPSIVALLRGATPVDIGLLNLNDDANSNDPNFRYTGGSGGQWIYNMRTQDLSAGDYVLTLGLPNGARYVVAFTVNDRGKTKVDHPWNGLPKRMGS